MPRQSKRVLDLSAAEVPTKAARKPMTDRQIAEYQSALAGLQRWLTRSRRASNAVAKYQKKVSYYRKLAETSGR